MRMRRIFLRGAWLVLAPGWQVAALVTMLDMLMVAEVLGRSAGLVRAIRTDRGPAQLKRDHGEYDVEETADHGRNIARQYASVPVPRHHCSAAQGIQPSSLPRRTTVTPGRSWRSDGMTSTQFG
jgi:hypothetical protein